MIVLTVPIMKPGEIKSSFEIRCIGSSFDSNCMVALAKLLHPSDCKLVTCMYGLFTCEVNFKQLFTCYIVVEFIF